MSTTLPVQVLDSFSIVLPLVSLRDSATGQMLDFQYFVVENNRLKIDTAGLRRVCPDCRSAQISYRVLPFDLGARVSRLDSATLRRNARPDAIEFDYTPDETSAKPWENASLVSNGAYTRGLSFGNNQNLVFNSNLNLQLNGKLGNDLELQAALSDNSIPLQPDGTTRQLQEFDRIFIQLRRKNTALTAGDYDLTRPYGYFSNYFKRLQGAMVEGRWMREAAPGASAKIRADTISYRAAAAISRGKFARQPIPGIEGNQGPYRLQGAEGERFIIVLAGTEKVFVDGILLRRGLEDDYIVDYNLGEVTFTARRLITKDSRIIVEFEYAVQNYLRSNMAANLSWNTPGARVYFNLFSEQDGRNNGGAQELSPAQRRRLAEAGDNLRNAVVSGIDTLPAFDPTRVLYRVVDTLVCGQQQQVLRYSTNPDSARFAVRFSEVPQGQGHYILALTAANGRVFRWVAPDTATCRPQGNFEPVVRLVAPESRQLYTVGVTANPFKGSRLQAEAALSNRDLNRFSPLGNGDNQGLAGFVNFQQQIAFPTDRWQAQVNAVYEHTARRFLPLNPYRPAEFVRDWNSNPTRDTAAEHLAKGGFAVQRAGLGNARYEFGAFNRQGVYNGMRHLAQLRLQQRGFDLYAEGNLLQTEGSIENTRFSRPRLDFSKTIFGKKDPAGTTAPPKSLPEMPSDNPQFQIPQAPALPGALFKIGLYGERERNERSVAGSDTLSRASFWYDLYRLYFQTPDPGARRQFGGFFAQRYDYFPLGARFKNSTVADEVNFNGSWRTGGSPAASEPGIALKPARKNGAATQQLGWNLNYRSLRVLDPEGTSLKPQESYLGRIDYNLTAWKNALNFTSGYELGSGQSPKLEFNYLRVNPGEGQYSWVDRNRDSILQIDEMEVAVFRDQASFVRIAVPTTQYLRTNNVLLNQNLRFEPRTLWGLSKKKWQKGLSRISTQSTLQINRRSIGGARGVSPWNPFQLDIADTALVTLNTSMRNVFFFNRANPAWDLSLAQGDNRSQIALTTGFERRRTSDWTLHARANLNRRWSLEADAVQGRRNSDNQAFDTRDFSIKTREYGPKLSWLPNRTFRIVLEINRMESQNRIGLGEKADQNNWNGELTWNPASKENSRGFRAATSLRAKFTYADIRYTGKPNTAVAFTMLEGLQNGQNLLWFLTLDRQLSKNMQLNLNYEGRRTGTGNRLVHVGRAQVRALF